ncbi:MAG TPA: carbohydrate kinase family protein [Candidatus Thermoplasmatota archaeon]|nr:carbohydrate kinase family protein [Candidatus Thermoplasmatota archaeon]
MLTVVGTVAFDTLARVKALASPEQTAGIATLQADAPGGTAGNVALALARLGAPSRLLASVGRDFERSAYAHLLSGAGIDTSALAVGELPTARAYIFFDDKASQVTYFYGGASTELTLRPESLARGRVHFCAGEISQYPSLMDAADWVSFDPGQELFHRDFAQIEACLPLVDLLFVNRHELEVVEARGWDLRRLFDAGPEAIVETRGGEGTLVHTPAGRFAAPAISVPAVDPTGAGDAHRAGFLYALERGADLGRSARFANVLGSFAVEHVGAQAGHPTLAQAIERYEKAYAERPF